MPKELYLSFQPEINISGLNILIKQTQKEVIAIIDPYKGLINRVLSILPGPAVREVYSPQIQQYYTNLFFLLYNQLSVFQCIIINIVRNTVARSYNYLKLNTKAIVKEVEKPLKDNRFMLSSLVSTLPFTILN